MTPQTIRRWSWLHTWSSLLCTLFLLMLCVTGLPLIFHDEIEHAFGPPAWTPANPDGPLLTLDEILQTAMDARPGDEVPLYMSFDTDRPVVNVTTGHADDRPGPGRWFHFAAYDRTSGAPVRTEAPAGGVMDFLLQLHTDMFLGLPGMLFLGAMGVVFAVAVVSGVVLYAPFMRKLDFGTLRTARSARLAWLDWHNLLGAVTIVWVLVVGLTGVVNTLATPIIDTWKHRELADLSAPWRGAPLPDRLASLDAAVAQAKAAAPDRVLQFVAFPGSAYATRGHFAVFLHGNTSLTSHLVTPALLDARSGEFIALREMPWYAKALSLSGPLHFGDYGGLPLKILWALLDVITIAVLVSGLQLWLLRRRTPTRDPVVELLAESASSR
jgi:uncharacterized iron-regulated membrane protein